MTEEEGEQPRRGVGSTMAASSKRVAGCVIKEHWGWRWIFLTCMLGERIGHIYSALRIIPIADHSYVGGTKCAE